VWERVEVPTMASEQKPPTIERLTDQIAWYNKKSQVAQRRYKILKIVQVIIAGVIPLMSAFPVPELEFRVVTAILGLLVLILEAVQQLKAYAFASGEIKIL
jgi:Protein of unknown function (DUF4231)